MNQHPLVEINTRTMLGKPVIKGTRITVEQILEKLSVVDSIEEVLQSHPHLTKAQVHAALLFAAAYGVSKN